MNKLLKKSCLALVFTAFSATSALAQSVAINSGKVVTNTDAGIVENAGILIENGRISQITADQTFSADTVITTSGIWITPGVFAAVSNLGLVEVGAVKSSNNTRADKIDASVSIRAADSFNPNSSLVPISRGGGVIAAAVIPGSSSDLFGGIGSIVSTDGSYDSILEDEAFIFLNYSGSSEKTGETKGAAMAFLRSAVSDARNFSTRFKGPDDGDSLRRADARALRPAVQGRIPLIVAADRAVDLVNLAKIKGENPAMRMHIIGAAEGWMVADQLAAANIGVMVDPMENLPSDFDTLGSRVDNVQKLKDAGVQTAIMARSKTGAYAHNLKILTQHAGNAVANGLAWEDAFKSITSIPAEMYGFGELGELAVGQTANLVVWDGDPLEAMSAPIAVIIDGKMQSMQSRQTELRDRYNPTRTDDTPYGYPTP